MFDKKLSQQLIQQIELYRQYKGKVDDETLKEIMENRGLKQNQDSSPKDITTNEHQSYESIPQNNQ